MKDDIKNENDCVDDVDITKDYIRMEADDFSFLDNLEAVPYLNNNSDSIQDELDEIEKNTKNIQNNLIAEGDDNVEYINFIKDEKENVQK